MIKITTTLEASRYIDLIEQPTPAQERHQTLGGLKTIMRKSNRAIFPVSGDCLEAVNVLDGGWVAVDFTHFPAPPRLKSIGLDGSTDLCVCYAVFPGTRSPAVMLKEYCGVWGAFQMVGTRYRLWEGGKHIMNCAMFADEIFGIVFASWAPDGTLLWERDPESFPEKLGAAPTIHGNNIGDPMPVRGEVSVLCPVS